MSKLKYKVMLSIRYARISDFVNWSCFCVFTNELVGYSKRLGYITHNINNDFLEQPIECKIDSVIDFAEKNSFA